MRAAAIAALMVLASAAGARADTDPMWTARLWLTAPAFGLEEDCPLAVIFRDPPFRSAAGPGGASSESRLVSSRRQGDQLVLVIDTPADGTDPDGAPERVTLDLLLHRAQDIVSVESIQVERPGGRQTLSYEDAVSDDDDYDVYTDTLVALYTRWFDPAAVRSRVGR